MQRPAKLLLGLLLAAIAMLATGCPPGPGPAGGPTLRGPALLPVHFDDPQRAIVYEGPIRLTAARNETTHFAVQLAAWPQDGGAGAYSLRVTPPPAPPATRPTGAALAFSNLAAYQVLPMPVNVNRAGYVRHTGLPATAQRLPRALLPLPTTRGTADLSALRDPAAPLPPTSHFGASAEPAQVWVDVTVPTATPPGQYRATCDLVRGQQVIAQLPIELTVYDFALPDDRHLLMVSQLDWATLAQVYPAQFQAVTVELLSRREAKYAPTIKALDQLVKLAQAHRLQAAVPAIQPIVKWPSGQPPAVDWQEFDSVVSPWLNGDAFPDRVPLGFWPIPPIERLGSYNRAAQLAYWSAAAIHFDQLQWLGRSAVVMERRGSAPPTSTDSQQLCIDASQLLSLHPRLRVALPLEEDQVQVATETHPMGIAARDVDRLMYSAPGLVSAPPVLSLPRNQATRWLRADLPGPVPYVGAGADEREVRLWAWLAFLRGAQLIQWSSPLPASADPAQPAGPDELAWFYPGSWFGVDQPVPTMQLKWLRRAQQDYEYLWLAGQRGQATRALVMARLIAKPVEIHITQQPDPTYALMCGTSDPKLWEDALRLLARTIILRQPGSAPSAAQENELAVQTMQWIAPQEHPLLLGRTTDWSLSTDPRNPRQIDLRLGLDIYNAADQRPDRNKLEWTGVPPAWQINPQPLEISQLATYGVCRCLLDAHINAARLTPDTRKPVDVTFTDGFTRRRTLVRLVLPVAYCEQREGPAPQLDGSLAEWTAVDAIHEGPLVQLLNRPALQRQELQWANTNSSLYSGWAPRHFYLAFRVEGVAAAPTGVETSFVDYQFRRAWGEDLCEVLVQPIYADGGVGPALHAVLKPHGPMQLERRQDAGPDAGTWQPVVGADVRYAATVKEAVWRGEVSVPWDMMNDPRHIGQRPTLLRFNFVQHRDAVGESASWAGPIDFGRDNMFTGLLVVHAPQAFEPGPRSNLP